MSDRVQHKESLPGQAHIKRRGPATRPGNGSESDSTDSEQEAQRTRREDDSDQASPLSPDAAPEHGGHSLSEQQNDKEGNSSSSTSSSSDSDSDDEDEEAIARENARLAQLRERAATTGGKAGPASASSSPAAAAAAAAAATTTGSYNHDVLFRRSEWRKANANGATAADGKEKERKWRMVVNNKEESLNYQHFLRKHFK